MKPEGKLKKRQKMSKAPNPNGELCGGRCGAYPVEKHLIPGEGVGPWGVIEEKLATFRGLDGERSR